MYFVLLHPHFKSQGRSPVGLERFSHIEEVPGSSPGVPTENYLTQKLFCRTDLTDLTDNSYFPQKSQKSQKYFNSAQISQISQI